MRYFNFNSVYYHNNMFTETIITIIVLYRKGEFNITKYKKVPIAIKYLRTDYK